MPEEDGGAPLWEDDSEEPEWEVEGMREALCAAVGLDPVASYDDKLYRDYQYELESLYHSNLWSFGAGARLRVPRLQTALDRMQSFQESLGMLGAGWRHTTARGRDIDLVEYLQGGINALRPLLVKELELKRQEAAWRPHGKPGRGRPPTKPIVYDVALVAARFYLDFAGTIPTHSTEGTTPFKRLLEALFRIMTIKTDTRRPAEWAIGQIASPDR